MDNWDPVKDMPDLHGKVAVVTGANSGIGFATVKFLAAKGAKVYSTARSEAKAKQAQAEQLRINPALSADNLPYLLMDLEDIASILAATKSLSAREDKLDILIQNAGGTMSGVETTKDGWERTMAINHLGPVVFVNGVLPLLKKAASYPGADVRIILTGSNAHHMMVPAKFPLDFSTPSVFQGKLPYTPLLSQVQQRLLFNMNMLHYGVAKVAVSLFARELQAVMDAQRLPILVVSTHPGGVRSDDVHTVFKPWLWPLISGTFIPVDQGTVVSLFMATDPAVRRKPEAYKGQYVEPTGVHPGHPILRDAAQQRALWNATESELNRCLTKKGHSPLLAW